MKNPDILQAIQPVISVFEKLLIPYYISGSIASSVYGTVRATMDVDIVADIKSTQVSSLKQLLEKEYYIDGKMIKDAIRRFSSFNLIHLETIIKIDVFIHKPQPYSEEVLQRRQKDTLVESEFALEFYFSSPEDVILNKLQWFKMGERVSEQQWMDVIGVIKVQGKNIDKEYLRKWGEILHLMDLLTSAFHESGLDF
ncbi:MAG: hypothetical protein KAW88_05095 [Candidatus Cloacimonetes bacterium]|nr:hypothetical protein [Candidatus Cloacimonadota bacterium]